MTDERKKCSWLDQLILGCFILKGWSMNLCNFAQIKNWLQKNRNYFSLLTFFSPIWVSKTISATTQKFSDGQKLETTPCGLSHWQKSSVELKYLRAQDLNHLRLQQIFTVHTDIWGKSPVCFPAAFHDSARSFLFYITHIFVQDTCTSVITA